MSDLIKLEWRINVHGVAEVDTPFGSYGVEECPGHGWRWDYCFDTYYDYDWLTCEDMAEGMSLAEEHWRDRVQPITKPLTDRIEELEAKLSESEALLAKAVDALDAIRLYSFDEDARRKAIEIIAELTSSEAANGEAKGDKDD